ncbi:MAG TPA: maleylpyruvate isomerase family mycothiol-dependent enzyme [Acidimicrobiia bacterium]|jgi:uncharacterized protein (TIGR03083 family)|nr:maleylpyruvate isomerase family mycothiol-dependent enzyme [Acidimicrobiia bacterium]
MADMMPMIHAERGSLSDFLGTLTPDQWSAPTFCTQWNVQQLVGHLVAAANITAPHFFGGLAKNGFSFDKFVDGDLRPFAAGTPTDVKQRFDSIITSTRTPPGPKYVALGEVMVHGEDIRRAFGVKGDHPADHLTALAEMYKKTGAPLRAKKRLAGLKLQATDVDWSTGSGPEIAGPAMALILAMVGRAKALDDCAGDGVETLRSRA